MRRLPREAVKQQCWQLQLEKFFFFFLDGKTPPLFPSIFSRRADGDEFIYLFIFHSLRPDKADTSGSIELSAATLTSN